MATLDSSIVNIALPTLTKVLGSDLHKVKWVVIIYLLVITCLLLPFGRLSDQYGRKRIFQMGFGIFTLGSILCGFSPTLAWLLFSRAVQGVGASMLMSNGPAIITAAFPAGERGRALGTLSMVVSAGLVSGPSIGGMLITHLGWRSIFLVNIPIGLMGFFLVQKYVFWDRLVSETVNFDWIGAFLQMVLLISFISLVDPPLISVSGSVPFFIPRWLLGIVIIALGALFVRVETDAKAPLLDLSLLKIRTFWAANLASFLTFVSYSAVTVLTPFFLEEVLHFAPDRAGLYMTAIPLTIFVVAPVSGHLSDRLGSRGLSSVGALIGATGLFLMSGVFGMGLHPEVGSTGIILGLCSIGLATGLFQSPNNNAIMCSIPPEKLGVGSALLATVRNLGLVSGTGLATKLFSWRYQESGNFTFALHSAFFVAGVVALGAMFASLAKKREIYGVETEGKRTLS